ncbi:MAG: acetate--CoA ligase [Candidatus Helarchaeota archaeon]|nr:acetate--CoA ligase [Candidatus Helarchaeota archaeon]
MSEEKTITSLLTEKRVIEPPKELSEAAWIKSMDQYREMWKESIENPEKFWGKLVDSLDWGKKPTKIWDGSKFPPVAQWFVDGKLNAAYNAVDRHIKAGKGEKVAIYWEGDDPSESRTYTYNDLLEELCRFGNVLLKYGLKKGDRVVIWLPMVPELVIAMLGAARFGIIHSVVFAGFSAEAVKDRIINSGARILITADGTFRGGKKIPLKETVHKLLEETPTIERVIVVKRTGMDIPMKEGRDTWWHDEVQDQPTECIYEEMDAEDPLFILYTSGTTGKPKGVVHTTAGYLMYASFSHKTIFDIHEDTVFFCSADIGWITGHTYIVYGPLLNGATEVMFEGVPTYPTYERYWEIIEKYKVNVFYTAPTAIRLLMKEGDELPLKHDLSSLRVLGSVGEPINPEAWMWFYKVIGKEKSPIVDTWWQTETGGIMITPFPGATPLKPGAASFPFFGVKAEIFRDDGSPADINEGGYLVITSAWPGMLRGVWQNPERFQKTYWSKFPGKYYSGDGARMDEDGYIWILGRLDDVIKVSGHRIGTMEVESALVSHPDVAEAAVVPVEHKIKGQAIFAYVILKKGIEPSEELKKELKVHVRKEIGPIAKPEAIEFTPSLPKTRSGKIMRRILKAIVNETDVGNITTLANPDVVKELWNAYKTTKTAASS